MATLEAAARNGACNGIVDLLNNGTIVFETSGDAEVATCTFGATAFGDAAAGVATAHATQRISDAAGGTIEQRLHSIRRVRKLMECTIGTSARSSLLDR